MKSKFKIVRTKEEEWNRKANRQMVACAIAIPLVVVLGAVLQAIFKEIQETE